MDVYYGPILEDIKSVVPQGTIVFEDRFKKFTSYQYAECWTQIAGVNRVICKTLDAVNTAPTTRVLHHVSRKDGKIVVVKRSKFLPAE